MTELLFPREVLLRSVTFIIGANTSKEGHKYIYIIGQPSICIETNTTCRASTCKALIQVSKSLWHSEILLRSGTFIFEFNPFNKGLEILFNGSTKILHRKKISVWDAIAGMLV